MESPIDTTPAPALDGGSTPEILPLIISTELEDAGLMSVISPISPVKHQISQEADSEENISRKQYPD
jgi:hypothetical protein